MSDTARLVAVLRLSGVIDCAAEAARLAPSGSWLIMVMVIVRLSPCRARRWNRLISSMLFTSAPKLSRLRRATWPSGRAVERVKVELSRPSCDQRAALNARSSSEFMALMPSIVAEKVIVYA